MENFKETKSLSTLAKKIALINDYVKKVEMPTYNDFLYYANITSQDFAYLYEQIMLNNNKAKKLYYLLERIKTKFELEMEKILRYQNYNKSFNYRLLKVLYDKSINSPISIHFKSIEIVGDTFTISNQNNNAKLSIPSNDSGIDIFDMRKKVNND